MFSENWQSQIASSFRDEFCRDGRMPVPAKLIPKTVEVEWKNSAFAKLCSLIIRELPG
jgi:hypothetical protein